MRDALSTKIASELCARIQSGELKENDKLPSERILASQYDVSRNVIRESIKMLVEKNLVINIPGKGNYVSRPTQSSIADKLENAIHLSDVPASEIVNARQFLEISVMEKYLLSITEQEIAQLEELYAKMEAARSNYALFWEYDTKFHLQLIGCSKNSILTLFLSTLYRMTQKNIIMNSEDPVSAIEFSQSDHAEGGLSMDIFVAAGQMLVLFAMMFTGYFLARRDWINDSLSSALSRLVVNIFNPFLMISSVFGQSLKQSGPLFWENLVLVGIFYLLLFLAGFFIVFVLRPTSQTAPIYKLLTLLPNCGFMGIPIVSSLLGAQYIIYVAVYMLVFNLIIYTYGISLVRRSLSDDSAPALSMSARLRQIFGNTGVLASLVTIVLFVTGFSLPENVQKFINYMGNPCVPLSMILIGCSLAASPLSKIFQEVRLYGFAFIKMFAIPIVASFVIRLLPFDPVILTLFIIMLALPSGSMVVLITEEYKGNVQLASAGVVLTTIVSLFSIPVVSLFVG